MKNKVVDEKGIEVNTGKSQLVYVNKTVIEYEDKLFELTKAALTGLCKNDAGTNYIVKKSIEIAKETLKQLNQEKI